MTRRGGRTGHLLNCFTTLLECLRYPTWQLHSSTVSWLTLRVNTPDLVISEVMWGEDVSLNTSSNSQYIELYNPGGQYKTVDDADHTPDINEALTLIFYAPNEFSAVAARTAVAATATAAAMTALPTGVTDRIGTLDAKGAYWNPVGKGQSGRSGTTATGTAAERGEFVPVVRYRLDVSFDGSFDCRRGSGRSNDGGRWSNGSELDDICWSQKC